MDFLIYHCSHSIITHSSILLTLFLAGLVGGFTHCAGMCGPFVATQTINKFDNLPISDSTVLKRLQGSALLPYHFGRMTTYVILGVIATILSRQIIGSPIERWVAAILLMLAGLVFIASATPYLKTMLKLFRLGMINKLAEKMSKLSKPLMLNPAGIRGYFLGVMLGFIPCGLIFAALMVVATTAEPTTAVIGMVLFTIGTFPSLFIVGLGSRFVFSKWPVTTRALANYVMLFNGLSLMIMATNIVF